MSPNANNKYIVSIVILLLSCCTPEGANEHGLDPEVIAGRHRSAIREWWQKYD